METAVDESKLIFFTGAPGSKWSATAHLLALSGLYNINTSDYNDDRIYTHPGPQISCLLYTSPSPRDSCASRMPSSA